MQNLPILRSCLFCRVGKTMLAKAFVTGNFPEAVKPTVGADLLFKTMHLGKHKAYVQVREFFSHHWVLQLKHQELEAENSFAGASSAMKVYHLRFRGRKQSLQAQHENEGTCIMCKWACKGKLKNHCMQIWETQLLSTEQHSLETRCRQATYGSIMASLLSYNFSAPEENKCIFGKERNL